MLTKIKQFIFYLGYELSLFQKVLAGLLAVAVVGFLGIQTTGLIAKVSSGLLKGSVTEGTEKPAASSTVLTIISVDQSTLSSTGSVAVKYALSTKPDAPYKFILTVLSDEVEVGKAENGSGDQAGVLTATVDAAHRTAASLTIRMTAEGGGNTVSDSVTIVGGAGSVVPSNNPPTTSTGSVLPPSALPANPTPSPASPAEAAPTPTPYPPRPSTGSGALPPGFGDATHDLPVGFPTGSGSVPPTPSLQCIPTGRTCAQSTDCCSQRCASLKIGSNVCLPKR